MSYLKGTVGLRATIRGEGVTFPAFDFDPGHPSTNRVTLCAMGGKSIEGTIYFDAVEDANAAITIASQIMQRTIDRIAFKHCLAIDDAVIQSKKLVTFNSETGARLFAVDGSFQVEGTAASLCRGLAPGLLRPDLEQSDSKSDERIGLFRSALLSASPVERFLHLYHLLLLVFDDNQAEVDAFIGPQEPGIATSPRPRINKPKPRSGRVSGETRYTRLRNEFAHRRIGVDMSATKAEMEQLWTNLRDLVKVAIGQSP